MILQRDRRLRREITEFGCQYMAILFLLNKHTNASLSIYKINSKLYKSAVTAGAMTKNCYVLDHKLLCNTINLKVTQTWKETDPTYICKEDESEILCFQYQDGLHFVAGDGACNLAYDPWGISKAVRHGRLVNRRILKL